MSKESAIRIFKRLLPLLLGVVILLVLYWRIGWGKLADAMGEADPALFVVALAFFVPQVLVMAWRWRLIGSTARPLGLWEACLMVLAGSSLNVFLPSKLGDMAKGLMLGNKAEHGLAGGIGLAALDKFMDLLGLAVVLVVAGMLAFGRVLPSAGSTTLVQLFWLATLAGTLVLTSLLHLVRPIARLPRRKLLAALARGLNAAFAVRHRRAAWAGSLLLSALLWFLHVAQIYVFYRAVAGDTPLPAADVFLRVPIAIFIGLLPVTVAGMGTRDSALVALIAPNAVALLVGLFCTLRYVVMAVLGLPAIWSLGPRLTRALEAARARRETPEPETGAPDSPDSA